MQNVVLAKENPPVCLSVHHTLALYLNDGRTSWVSWICRTGKCRTGKWRTKLQGWKPTDWEMTDWKLTDRKMTDGTKWTKNEGLTSTDRNLQDWKMTDWKITDRLTKRTVNVNSWHKFICTLQPRIAHFGYFQHSNVCTYLICVRNMLLPYSLTSPFYSIHAQLRISVWVYNNLFTPPIRSSLVLSVSAVWTQLQTIQDSFVLSRSSLDEFYLVSTQFQFATVQS